MACFLIAIVISAIHPIEFEAYLLHQAGTVFMLILLFVIFKKIGLDFLSFIFYLLFLLIHIVGAHYLYSYVPYNDWIQQAFNFNLDQYMGWSRNMYDRLVHLAYGIFSLPCYLSRVSGVVTISKVIQSIFASGSICNGIKCFI